MEENWHTVASEEEMMSYGEDLAKRLHPGDVVALQGDLGAGKTHLCKGIVSGLGSDAVVTSPTFALVQEYRDGSCPVFHFDFYRLDSVGELRGIGWEEYLDEDGILLVEWASKFREVLPPGTRWIRIERAGENGRKICEG